jgi:predicted RNA-binding Zn ribbon-like protein
MCDNSVIMPRPRTLMSVEDMPLVGGDPCLDFVNTTGARSSGAPRERLTRYEDFITWGERVGILDKSTATQLRRVTMQRKAAAARALARAHAFREDLYRLLSDLAAGRRPTVAAMRRFERHWRAARRRQELVPDKGRFELQFKVQGGDLEQVMPPIVIAAIDLLTSERVRLLRRCAECDWLFLDESKNGTRRWCKSMCGNRARSRERYERVRQAASAPLADRRTH